MLQLNGNDPLFEFLRDALQVASVRHPMEHLFGHLLGDGRPAAISTHVNHGTSQGAEIDAGMAPEALIFCGDQCLHQVLGQIAVVGVHPVFHEEGANLFSVSREDLACQIVFRVDDSLHGR